MTDQSDIHDPGKRKRLIASAAAAFSRVGYERASVDEIAASAEVAKGTVYLYFPSKAALFLAVLSELQEQIEGGDDIAAAERPDGALRGLIRKQLALAAASPDLFRCYTSALFGVNRDFQEAALSIFTSQKDHVAHNLRAMIEAPRMTKAIERRASLFVAAMLAAALVGGLEGGRAVDGGHDEDALMMMLREPVR